jgi:hypothetical protein
MGAKYSEKIDTHIIDAIRRVHDAVA